MQKILVVEDDLDIQELLKNFLQEAGYSIVLANDAFKYIAGQTRFGKTSGKAGKKVYFLKKV